MVRPSLLLPPYQLAAGRATQVITDVEPHHRFPALCPDCNARSKPIAIFTAPIGRPVPTESYTAVAEVLAYVYQLKGRSIPVPPQAA